MPNTGCGKEDIENQQRRIGKPAHPLSRLLPQEDVQPLNRQKQQRKIAGSGQPRENITVIVQQNGSQQRRQQIFRRSQQRQGEQDTKSPPYEAACFAGPGGKKAQRRREIRKAAALPQSFQGFFHVGRSSCNSADSSS